MALRITLLALLFGLASSVRPSDMGSLAQKTAVTIHSDEKTAIVFRSDGHLAVLRKRNRTANAQDASTALEQRSQPADVANVPAPAPASVDETVSKKTHDTSGVDDFMADSKASGQACYSRLLQAKLFLDKLVKDMTTMFDLIWEQYQRKRAEEDNLKKAQASIALIKENHRTAVGQCSKEFDENMEDVRRYDRELIELKSIANPEVSHHKYSHNEDVAKAQAEAAKNREAKKGTSLVQENMTARVTSLLQDESDEAAAEISAIKKVNFTEKACLEFVGAVHRYHLEHALGMTEEESAPRGCEKNRERLKDVFVETYINVTERRMATLHEVTRTKEECLALAKQQMEEALQPPVEDERLAQIEVNEATSKIEELYPLYEALHARRMKLVEATQDLEQECIEELDASDTMRAIRHLIHRLSKCPSAEELKLTIPDVVMDPVMVIDLKWHNKNDLDLSLQGPLGTIKHDPTRVAGEGFLDHDSNFPGSSHFKQITSEPREAIFLTKALNGQYEVGIRLFTLREAEGIATNFECELKSKLFLKELCMYDTECEHNVELSDEVGERKVFEGTIEGTSEQFLKLMSFTIADNGVVPPDVDELDDSEHEHTEDLVGENPKDTKPDTL